MQIKLDKPMTDDTRLALLEQSICHISESLLRIEKRFDHVDEQFNRVDEKFNRLEDEVKSNRSLSWSHFRWIMGSIVGVFGAFICALINGHII